MTFSSSIWTHSNLPQSHFPESTVGIYRQEFNPVYPPNCPCPCQRGALYLLVQGQTQTPSFALVLRLHVLQTCSCLLPSRLSKSWSPYYHRVLPRSLLKSLEGSQRSVGFGPTPCDHSPSWLYCSSCISALQDMKFSPVPHGLSTNWAPCLEYSPSKLCIALFNQAYDKPPHPQAPFLTIWYERNVIYSLCPLPSLDIYLFVHSIWLLY